MSIKQERSGWVRALFQRRVRVVSKGIGILTEITDCETGEKIEMVLEAKIHVQASKPTRMWVRYFDQTPNGQWKLDKGGIPKKEEEMIVEELEVEIPVVKTPYKGVSFVEGTKP